jgi:hypothetical protein
MGMFNSGVLRRGFTSDDTDHARSARTTSVLPPSPMADRGRRPGWRDPRVIAGVGLIAVCALIGGTLLANAGPSGLAWSAVRDLGVGAVLTPEDVVAVPVDLGDASMAYADAATQTPPTGRLITGVRAGELLPAAAVTTEVPADIRLVTVAVEPLHGPADLAPGDRVDVWTTAQSGLDGGDALPTLALERALVAAVSYDETGVSGDIGVVLEVPVERIGALVAALRSGALDLVRVPGVDAGAAS